MDLVIKLIQVNGQYKALVIDELKSENRLMGIFESMDMDIAYNMALDFVSQFKNAVWQ